MAGAAPSGPSMTRSSLSWGGAGQPGTGYAIGKADAVGAGGVPLSGLSLGGYVIGDYRIGFSVTALSGKALGAGVDLYALPGSAWSDTSLSLRVVGLTGGGFSGTSGGAFSLNPATARFGLTDSSAQNWNSGWNGGTALTVNVDHALTPSISVVGRIEVQQDPNSSLQTNPSQVRYTLGAGLGIRF